MIPAVPTREPSDEEIALIAELTRLQREVGRLGIKLDQVRADFWRLLNDFTHDRSEE